LKTVPTVWDDTRALDAEVAKHLVVARLSGQAWFLGGLTGNDAYDANVRLEFLKKGRWRLLHCAPGGGFTAWLRRE
jgi:alpha-glucosidase